MRESTIERDSKERATALGLSFVKFTLHGDFLFRRIIHLRDHLPILFFPRTSRVRNKKTIKRFREVVNKLRWLGRLFQE